MTPAGWTLMGLSWAVIILACVYLLYKTLSTPRGK